MLSRFLELWRRSGSSGPRHTMRGTRARIYWKYSRVRLGDRVKIDKETKPFIRRTDNVLVTRPTPSVVVDNVIVARVISFPPDLLSTFTLLKLLRVPVNDYYEVSTKTKKYSDIRRANTFFIYRNHSFSAVSAVLLIFSLGSYFISLFFFLNSRCRGKPTPIGTNPLSVIFCIFYTAFPLSNAKTSAF